VKTLPFILWMLFPLSALGQVYKCSENGKMVYSDTPCTAAATQHASPPVGSPARSPQSTARETLIK